MTALPEFLLAPLFGDEDVGNYRSSSGQHKTVGSPEDEQARDLRLLELIRHGSEAAFSELFDLYWGALCTFGERVTGSIDVARDIVQDVMIRFWALRESVKIQTSVRAYLYSAVRNRAIHYMQHDRVVHRTETFFAMLGSSPGMGTTEATEDVVARHELAFALNQVISQLPPRTRQVALLKWGDRLSRMEIAQVMGTRPFTVDKQIAAATRAVREALEVFLSENSSGE